MSSTPSAKQQRNDLTQGPLPQHLRAMSLPMIVGILAVIGFNFADTLFISSLGTDPLAAISLTFPVVFSLSSLTLGLGVGVASVVARASGQGDRAHAQRLTTHALLLGLTVVTIFLVIGFLTIDPLFRALGAKPKLLPLVHEYMEIWYLGMFFLIIPMIGNAAIRAIGDARFPAMVMVVAGVVNLILDPFLIFGWGPFPRLEMQGAAIATVASRSITAAAAIWVLHKRENLIRWSMPRLQELWTSWKEILYIGLPASANQMLGPLSLGLITSLLSVYGKETIAGFGAATRIESLFMIGIFAVSAGNSPIVGQNWGANRIDRVNGVVCLSFRLCLFYGLGVAVLLGLVGPFMSQSFNPKEAVYSVTNAYLWIVPISYGTMGLFLVSSSTFSSIGKPGPASILTFLRAFGLYVPLALLGRKLFHAQGVFVAAALANVITGLLGMYWLKTMLATERVSLKPEKVEGYVEGQGWKGSEEW